MVRGSRDLNDGVPASFCVWVLMFLFVLEDPKLIFSDVSRDEIKKIIYFVKFHVCKPGYGTGDMNWPPVCFMRYKLFVNNPAQRAPRLLKTNIFTSSVRFILINMSIFHNKHKKIIHFSTLCTSNINKQKTLGVYLGFRLSSHRKSHISLLFRFHFID